MVATGQRVDNACPVCGAPDGECIVMPAGGVTILTLRAQGAQPMYTSDTRVYLNADKTAVVPETSREATFLLVGAGGQLPESEARRYGLLDEPVPSAEATPAAPPPAPTVTKAPKAEKPAAAPKAAKEPATPKAPTEAKPPAAPKASDGEKALSAPPEDKAVHGPVGTK